MEPLTDSTDHLRVLIANERKDRLALVASIVVALGHEVIAREIDAEDVGTVTARERPDVALVGLGESSEHALDLIDKIVREAACPVIVLLHARSRSDNRKLIDLASRCRRRLPIASQAPRMLLRSRDDASEAGPLADRAFHLEFDQAVHLDGVLHRELLDDRLDESVDDQL